MRRLLTLLALAAPLWLLPPAAWAEASVQTPVGLALVEMPVPEGFADGLRGLPPMRQLAERMTPPSNRLLALFVSEADRQRLDAGQSPVLERYFMAQTLRQAENETLGLADFGNVREMLRTQYQTMFKSLAPAFQQMLDQAAGSLQRAAGLDTLSLKIGEMQGLEIFDDRPSSISLLAVTKYAVQANGRTEEIPMAIGITTAVLKRKLVYFYAYSTYRAPADLDFVRKSTLAWLPRAASAN